MLKRNIKIFLPTIAFFALAGTALAAGGDFVNPLGFDTVEGLLGSVLSRMRAIIAILAIIFIVIGGIMYMTSTGDPAKAQKAKGTIMFAMIGLAIAIAAPSLLAEIADILNWDACADIADAAQKQACLDAVGDPLTLSEIALNFLKFLLVMIGAISIIMLVVGGLMYITSGGDEQKVDTAKKTVTNSIIGLTVALSAMVIVNQVAAIMVGA